MPVSKVSERGKARKKFIGRGRLDADKQWVQDREWERRKFKRAATLSRRIERRKREQELTTKRQGIKKRGLFS